MVSSNSEDPILSNFQAVVAVAFKKFQAVVVVADVAVPVGHTLNGRGW